MSCTNFALFTEYDDDQISKDEIRETNFVVEWLAFLPRIHEAPALNLGPETGKLD
jgi:hypothetical protein